MNTFMQIASPCGSKKQALTDLSVRLSCLTQRSQWVLSLLYLFRFFMMQWGGSIKCRWIGCSQANGFQGGCQSNVSSPPPSSPFSQVTLQWLEGPCLHDRTSHAIKDCSLHLLSLHKRKKWAGSFTHRCHMPHAIHAQYVWAVGETVGPKQN